MMLLATIVDLGAIARILAAAVVVGVGVTAVFAQGALAWERLEEGRAGSSGSSRVRDGVVVALAGVVCVGALALGVGAMMDK